VTDEGGTRMDNYPSRVTLGEDGVLRWSYDMDMWHNRYMIGLVFKIIGLMLGIPTLLAAVAMLMRAAPLMADGVTGDRLRSFLRDDLILLAVVGGMLAGMLLLGAIIYAICAAVMKGRYHLCFQMDDSAVALVRNPKTMGVINTLGIVAAIAGLAAGKPGESLRLGSTLAAANSTGTSRFDAARRVKIVEKCDVLDIREFFGMNQIYVPPEDFEYVKEFILARIPEKARIRSER